MEEKELELKEKKQKEVELKKQHVGDMSSLLGVLFGSDDDVLSTAWLHSPMSIAPASGMAAVARGRAVAWKRMDSDAVDMHLPDVCTDTGNISEGDDAADHVTAIQWIEVDSLAGAAPAEATSEQHQAQRIQVALLIGCASGRIRLLAANGGATLLSQRLHGAQVRGFKLRGVGTCDGTQDLLIVYEDNVVVRIDGGVLVLRMQSSIRQGQREVGDPIDHGKWQLNGQGVVCDVVCCGVDSQAEGSDFFGATYYKLLGGGSQPTLSLYAACDERTATTTSEIVSKVCIQCVPKKKNY
jgi:hypothetical protein